MNWGKLSLHVKVKDCAWLFFSLSLAAVECCVQQLVPILKPLTCEMNNIDHVFAGILVSLNAAGSSP